MNGTTVPPVPPVPVLDAGRIARLRDVLAGGDLALEADRLAAASILDRWPATAALVTGANEFHRRAAAWAVKGGSLVPPAAGVIFAACGYPLPGKADAVSGRRLRRGFHAAAQAARPGALFAYASADPVTVRWCRSLLAAPDPLRVSAFLASARDPAALLGAPAVQVITDRGPVMVQLQFCCQRWPGEFAAWAVARYAELLPPGSTLALSLGIPGGAPSAPELVADLSRAGGGAFCPHGEAEVAGWITDAGLKLVPPGIADVRGRGWATAELAALRPAARVIEAVALVP